MLTGETRFHCEFVHPGTHTADPPRRDANGCPTGPWFQLSSGSHISACCGANYKLSKAMPMLFLPILLNNLVLTKPSCPKMPCDCMCHSRHLNFLYLPHREKRPLHPLPMAIVQLDLIGWCWPWGKEPLLLVHTSDKKSGDWGVSTQKIRISHNVILLGVGWLISPCHALKGAVNVIWRRVNDYQCFKMVNKMVSTS